MRLSRIEIPAPRRRLILFFVFVGLVGLVSWRISHTILELEAHILLRRSAVSLLRALPFTICLWLVGMLLVSVRQSPGERVGLFSIGFLVRILAGVVLALVWQLDDEAAWHKLGEMEPAKQIVLGITLPQAGHGYFYSIGMLYRVFGPNLLLGKTLNAFLGTLMAFLLYDIGAKVYRSKEAAQRLLYLVVFLPPLITFSALNLKETSTSFLLVAVLWGLATRKSALSRRTVSSVSVYILFLLRGPGWALVGLSILFAHGLRTVLSSDAGAAGSLRYLRLIVMVALFALIGRYLLVEVSRVYLSRVGIPYFTERFRERGATTARFLDADRVVSARNTAVGFLRALYFPSPLRVLFDRSIGVALIEMPGAIAWYLLFPTALVGAIRYRNNDWVFLCIVVFSFIFVWSALGRAFGADIYRHRIVGFPLLCVLHIAGRTGPAGAWDRQVFRLWWVGALFANLLYVALRAT